MRDPPRTPPLEISAQSNGTMPDGPARWIAEFQNLFGTLHEMNAFASTGALHDVGEPSVARALHVLFLGRPSDYPEGIDTGRDLTATVDAAARELNDIPLDDLNFRVVRDELSEPHLRTGAYRLLFAAIKVKDVDLVRRALALEPFEQADLLKRMLEHPHSDRARKLQMAINGYARNELVKTAPTEPRGALGNLRLVLHVGVTKTGSTYLQNLMEANRPELLRRGVWYPEVGLYWQGPRPEKQAGHSRFNDAAVGGGSDLRRHLRAGVRILGDRLHTIILSSEAFFLHEKSHRIPGYLSDFDCEIVIYLRRQDEWANSQYCELVAGGAVDRVSVPIDEWLRLDEVRARMDYRNALARFASAVPREKITVRVFDRLAMKGGDLVEDFADAAGIPELLDLERPEKSQANMAIFNSAHIEKLRTLNAFTFKGRDGYREFTDEVGRGIAVWQRSRGLEQVPAMMLTMEDRRNLLEENRAANEEIARNWLGKQGGQLFNTEMTGDFEAPQPLHSEEIAIINKSFMHWAKKGSALDVARPRTESDTPGIVHSSRIVNYGVFGWRLWALTPLVRMQVKQRGTRVDLVAFDRDPAGFFATLESPGFRAWARRLYPDKSPLGPGRIFAVWVVPLAWVLARLRGEMVANRFRADPILFTRKIKNPLLRAAGRLVFPMGEAVPDESVH